MRISLPLLACLAASSGMAAHAQTNPISTSEKPAPPNLAADYGKLPLSFEANQGQTGAQVRFLSQGNGYSLFLTDSSAVLVLTKTDGPKADLAAPGKFDQLPAVGKSAPSFDETIRSLKQDRLRAGGRSAPFPIEASAKTQTTDVVRMGLVGVAPGLKVEGEEKLPGTANYFIGNDPARWRTSVPTYAKVKYAGVYPGVDLVYYGNQRQLEYDFVVAPGADPKQVKLHFAGAESLKLTPEGDLEIVAKNGEVAFHKPVVYQVANGVGLPLKPTASLNGAPEREMVEGKFVLLAGNTAGFRVGSYDKGRELVIDPTLAYSTYLGGTGNDQANGIAVDSTGHAYVTGYTLSPKFPTVDPYQGTNNNTSNGVAFVTKLNKEGSALDYSTYLGGSGGCTYYANEATAGDSGHAVAVDASGDAYVAGQACSADFPTKGAYQAVNHGATKGVSNAFVTKLSPDGSSLIYSTYLGGSGNLGGFAYVSGDYALGIAVDGDGDAYVGGGTWSNDFPTMDAYQATSPAYPTDSGFVTKLNSTGSGLVYSTYLGGNFGNTVDAVAVDSSGLAYVTGYAQNSTFPTTSNAYQGYKGGSYVQNAFVTVLNATGNNLVYSTYLGGSGVGPGLGDNGSSIAVDASKYAYVGGFTYSQNFPTLNGYQLKDPDPSGKLAGFVAKLDTVSGALVYSTYLGGSGGDQVNGINIDAAGNAYVVGSTYSYASSTTTGFPVTSGAYQSTNNAAANSGSNAFFTKINPSGNALLYSTYLGGSGVKNTTNGDGANGIALDSLNNPYFAGVSYSTNFPTTKGSFQPATKATTGNSNAFAARFVFHTATTTTVTSDESSPQFGQTVTFTAYVPGKAGSEIQPTGTVSFSIDGGTPVPVALDDTEHAAYSISTLGVGSHTISAAYSGDVNYFPSTGSLPVTVSAASTSTSLSSSPNPSTVGEAVIFTATVTASSGPTPTGTVSFYHGGTLIGTAPLSDGVATLSYSGLTAGDHSMTADYGGSASDAKSVSAALTQVVNL